MLQDEENNKIETNNKNFEDIIDTFQGIFVLVATLFIFIVLTIPAINTTIQTALIGPKLKEFIDISDGATRTYMLQNSKDRINLYEYIDIMRQNSVAIYDKSAFKIPNPTRRNRFARLLGETVFKMPNNMQFAIFDANSEIYECHPYWPAGLYKGSLACIVVNTNPKQKYVPGKNVFSFVLDANGLLVPVGSKIARELMASDGAGKVACEEYFCTGYIVDNDYRAILPNSSAPK